MGDYYDHYYEDPYLAAYSMSEEYPEIHKEYIQKSTAFVEALGGFGSPLWKLNVTYTAVAISVQDGEILVKCN